VQSVQWHSTEAAVLASAGYDQKLAVLDVRAPAAAAFFALGSDPECLLWDPHDGSKLFAGTEDGAVACWDVRKVCINRLPKMYCCCAIFCLVSEQMTGSLIAELSE
jgi:WD40 repeat protein